MKGCESCQHFIKLDGYGLCEDKNARTNSDHGKNCKEFKRKKYDRGSTKLLGDE